MTTFLVSIAMILGGIAAGGWFEANRRAAAWKLAYENERATSPTHRAEPRAITGGRA